MDNNEGCGTYSVLIGLGAIVCIGMIIFNSCSGRNREVQPTSQVDTVLPIFDSIPIRDSSYSYSVPSVVPSQSVSSSSEYSTPDDAYDEGYSDGYEQGREDGRKGYVYGARYDDSNNYDNYLETKYQEGYEEGYDEGYSDGKSAYEEDEEGENDE